MARSVYLIFSLVVVVIILIASIILLYPPYNISKDNKGGLFDREVFHAENEKSKEETERLETENEEYLSDIPGCNFEKERFGNLRKEKAASCASKRKKTTVKSSSSKGKTKANTKSRFHLVNSSRKRDGWVRNWQKNVKDDEAIDGFDWSLEESVPINVHSSVESSTFDSDYLIPSAQNKKGSNYASKEGTIDQENSNGPDRLSLGKDMLTYSDTKMCVPVCGLENKKSKEDKEGFVSTIWSLCISEAPFLTIILFGILHDCIMS